MLAACIVLSIVDDAMTTVFSILENHTHSGKFCTKKITKVAFHLYGLSGPTSQFLNGTNEFSELVLARMSLLMEQRSSVLPLRSAKAREFGKLWRENVHARLRPYHLNWSEPVLFGRPERTNGKRPKKQLIVHTWLLVR